MYIYNLISLWAKTLTVIWYDAWSPRYTFIKLSYSYYYHVRTYEWRGDELAIHGIACFGSNPTHISSNSSNWIAIAPCPCGNRVIVIVCEDVSTGLLLCHSPACPRPMKGVTIRAFRMSSERKGFGWRFAVRVRGCCSGKRVPTSHLGFQAI